MTASFGSIDPATAFASPAALARSQLGAWLPPERVSVADYAAAHRWLDNRGGGYVGRWSHDEAPYLIEPMRVLTAREHLTTVVVGPARSGKTAISQNWMLQAVGADPADMLVYMQTDDAVQSYVKREINPMIDAHDTLRSKLGRLPVDRSLHFKRFRGMWIEFLAAAYSNLISKSAPRIIVDEIDAYPDGIGDVMGLVDVRRASFGRQSMVLAVSHPDRAGGLDPTLWRRGIMKSYADSDRRVWWWPCPECGAWSSPCPAAAHVMRLDWPEDAPLEVVEDQARLICPHCGALINDDARRGMNVRGRWIGAGEAIAADGTVSGVREARDTAGFWIVGVMSPFLLGGIGGLARELARARRETEATGDDAGLRDVTVKRLGIPYDPPRRIGSVDAAALADRAREDLALDRVPEGVRFLTAFLDVQANRFELLVRGWGEGGRSWIVRHRRILAETATQPADWDSSLAEAMAPVALADGSGRRMRVRVAGYDSGGAPGVTQQAYDAWRRLRAARVARNFGVLDGREAWNVLPTKGLGSPNAQRLAVSYPEGARKDRAASAGGLVPVLLFAANAYKDDLAGQLATIDGNWTVAFPAALRSPQPPHAFFEGLCAETRSASGAWSKLSAAARNEPIDLMVGCQALAELHGLRRIDWARPPIWAAVWDKNPMIEMPGADAQHAGPAPARVRTPALPSQASAPNSAASRISAMA